MTRADLPDDALVAVGGRTVGAPVAIERLGRMAGGASRESWSFDAVAADGTRTGLVLRRDPGGYAGQSARSVEFDLLRAVHAGGVAVPEPLTLLAPEDGLGAGFVMERIDGETIPRRILRDDEYAAARPRLVAQCGQQAARIHAVPPAALPELPTLLASDQITQYRDVLDLLGEPHPAFELALRWLGEHEPPPPPRPQLVHGDFRNGNLVVGEEGLRSVLDWELAHLGDPVEDLGWLCVKSWRFGHVDAVVGGFGAVPDLIDAYRAAGGGEVEPERLRYWEAFGTLKWGVICQMQASMHLEGAVRSVELAALGRRVAEMEWDVLELIA